MKVVIKILLIICCLLVTIAVDAQIGVKRKVFSEFRVGANSSEMDIENGNWGKRAKIGFHFGLSTSYKFYDSFYVQSGAYLTKKGLKQKEKKTEVDYPTALTTETNIMHTIDANYVQIPLMLGWESQELKSWSFNVNAGIYGAWGFEGETKERGTITRTVGSALPDVENVSEKYDTFSSSGLKKFDYGMIGSIGVVYEIFSLNLGYEYGLYNVSNTGNRDLKNRNLTLSLGFRF